MEARGMISRTLGTMVLVAALVAPLDFAGAQGRREIQPHMAGWERILAVEYGPGEYRGQFALEGTVTNISPYDLTRIQLLVDTLDTTGQVISQNIAYVPGELRGGGRVFFSVPAAEAPAYRVRVYTYDRIESNGRLR
jgi:hypothetical protein